MESQNILIKNATILNPLGNGKTEEKNADLLIVEDKIAEKLISYWENGQRECDFDMLIKIADLFSVSIDYLLGRDVDDKGGKR